MGFLVAGRFGTRVAAILLLAAVLVTSQPARLVAASGNTISESQLSDLHAALVFKISMFVHWPQESPSLVDDRISLAVSGNDDVFSAFKKLANKTIKGQQITLNRTVVPDDFSASRILFLSSDQPYEIAPWPGVLTVGDSPDFNSRGGMIRLSLVNGRPRFSINLEAADAAGIEFSSKLLKIAIIYKEDIQ